MRLFDDEPAQKSVKESRRRRRFGSTDEAKWAGWYRTHKSEIVSAFMKCLRLGLTRDALWWAWVMKEGGEAGRYLAYRVESSTSEDVVDVTAHVVVHALCDRYRATGDNNSLWQAIVVACQAKKLWQDPDAMAWSGLWHWGFKKEFDPHKIADLIPAFAIDSHTKKGRARAEQGLLTCELFSGSEEGHKNLARMAKDGTLLKEVEKWRDPIEVVEKRKGRKS